MSSQCNYTYCSSSNCAMAWSTRLSAILWPLLVALSVCNHPVNTRNEVTPAVLHLLVVLPLQDGGGATASWERGLEILPAAHIAVERINQDPNILPGYQLELVEIDSQKCSQSGALVEFVKRTVHTADQGVVGMVGLFCPSVVELLSPLAGHRGFNLLQISASASEQLYNEQRYPNLYHIVQSSDVYVDALLGLMQSLEWNRIGVISDSENTYYSHVANLFLGALNVTISGSFYPSFSFTVSDIVDNIVQLNSKVNFVSLSAPFTIELLCTVYRAGYTWPEYAWILHSYRVEDLLVAEADCDIQAALEGVVLLQQELETDDPFLPLVSGETYSEYRARYLEYLAQFAQEKNVTLRSNLQANVLHDSVWAFALALNNSIEELQLLNKSLSDYRLGDEEITSVVSEQLSQLSFAGAFESKVELSTEKHQTATSVGIFQGLNGMAIYKAHYDTAMNAIVNGSFSGTIPNDELPTVRNFIPIQFRIILYVITFFAFLLVTITLILFIWFRNEPDIKASSVFISLFMFFGCYVLLGYLLVLVLDLRSDTQDFCQVEVWLNGLGYATIFSTLLVKMLRVYRIFSHFGNTGKFWSDKVLVLLILLVLSPAVLVLLIWTIVDRYHIVITYTIFPDHIEVDDPCYSDYLILWASLLYTHAFILCIALITVAVKTRKIRRKNFKDTKKVNAFIYLEIMVFVLSLSYWAVLRTDTLVTGSLALYVGHVISVILVQVILFIPKVFPPLWRRLTKRQTSFKPTVATGIFSTLHIRFSHLESKDSTTKMTI